MALKTTVENHLETSLWYFKTKMTFENSFIEVDDLSVLQATGEYYQQKNIFQSDNRTNDYWGVKYDEHRLLAPVAHRMVSIPSSPCASECYFSLLKLVVDPGLSRLRDEILAALVYLRSAFSCVF